jgi:hypothetical protein
MAIGLAIHLSGEMNEQFLQPVIGIAALLNLTVKLKSALTLALSQWERE